MKPSVLRSSDYVQERLEIQSCMQNQPTHECWQQLYCQKEILCGLNAGGAYELLDWLSAVTGTVMNQYMACPKVSLQLVCCSG